MSWINENKFRMGIIYINLLFTMLVMKKCYRIQHFNFILVSILFIMTIIVYYFYSAVIKKISHRLLVTSALVFIASFLIYKNLWRVLEFINEKYINNFNGINELLYRGATTDFQLFKPFIILFFPIIVIVLLILYKKKATEAVLLLNLTIILLFWYLEYVEEIKSVLVIFVALSVFTYALNNHLKYLKKMQKLEVKNNLKLKTILLNIIIFSLFIAFIGLILPQNFQGNFSQESMERWTNPFSPDPRDTIGKAKEGRYGLNTSGYTNTETQLGGPLTLNSQLVFQVKSDKPLYLRGDVKVVYTGRAWRISQENYSSKSDISKGETNKFLKENILRGAQANTSSITIIPQKIITNTMFVPYYTSKVINSRGNVYFEPKGETFINSSKISKEYTVEFYDANTVSEYIKRSYMYRDMIVNINQNQEYLAYPEQTTQRTKDLVKSIVRNLNTNKDKVEAIQAYLTKNYPYTLEVSAVPQDQEFLDYFLFTEKKGYCTYFATAMTIMCRIAGIPARYVEGFKMSEPSVNGFYDVTNEQAHAWTEVLYMSNPDIWIVKDPSPTPLEERQRIAEENRANGIIPPVENQDTALQDDTENQEELQEEDIETEIGAIGKSVDYKFIIATNLISIFVFYLVMRLILFMNRKRLILNHKSNIPLYNYCNKRLKRVGLIKHLWETDKDFVAKIPDIEFRDALSKLVDSVYEEFYGGINSSNINKHDLYITLENYIKKREKRLVYIVKKYYI